MAKILLGVTGSVAAIRTPRLFEQLRARGHQVRVIATAAAVYFFDPVALDASQQARNPDVVTLDEDEWPGRDAGRRYAREDPVPHIELRRWADLFLIAPLDANTLAKLAGGLADNCLTCVLRAWDPQRPLILAPAMNTVMWEHPLTTRHLRQIAEDATGVVHSLPTDSAHLIEWINAHAALLRVIPPIRKRLACGDEGVGAMAEVETIVDFVQAFWQSVKPSSP